MKRTDYKAFAEWMDAQDTEVTMAEITEATGLGAMQALGYFGRYKAGGGVTKMASLGGDPQQRVHDDGGENVGRYWYAARWEVEDGAKAAWEQAYAESVYIACWRTKEPRENPRTHSVWLMGEDPAQVATAIAIMDRHGGRELAPEEIEDGFIHALRMRRFDQMVERAAAAERGEDPEAKTMIRTPSGRTMDHIGRMKPHRKGQG